MAVDRIRKALDARRQSVELPSTRRAAILVARSRDTVDIADFDWLLEDPLWLQEAIDEDDTVSTHTRTVSLTWAVDSSDNFIEALTKLHALGVAEHKGDIHGAALAVLDGEHVVGLLREEHLVDSLPVRVAVLSILLELEESIIEWALADPQRWQSALSSGRLDKARRQAKRKSDRALLGATQFCDKRDILKKSGWHRTFLTQDELEWIEPIRNWCAHTNDGSEGPPAERLLRIIHAAREMIPALRLL